MAFLATDIAD